MTIEVSRARVQSALLPVDDSVIVSRVRAQTAFVQNGLLITRVRAQTIYLPIEANNRRRQPMIGSF